MAALTPTKLGQMASPGGEYVMKFFEVTPSTASDTVDLTTHFDSILDVKAVIYAGLDANLTFVVASESGETVTLVQKKADGATAADDWTGAKIRLAVFGTQYPQ